MQEEGRTAGDRAPGLADDSLGDTHSVLPDLEREAEARRRAEVAGERGEGDEDSGDGETGG